MYMHLCVVYMTNYWMLLFNCEYMVEHRLRDLYTPFAKVKMLKFDFFFVSNFKLL